MRIGIDCRILRQGQVTGIPNYVRNLTSELKKLETKHEFVFFDGPKGGVPFWSNHVSYAKQIEKARLDLFHGPANTSPFFYKGKSIVTIHDLAIYKHPEWFPRGQWLATKVVVPNSIRKADRIIVPSEATKRDVQELFGIRDEKIAVIAEGVESRFFEKSAISDDKFQISKKYILFVGTLEPRKNLKRVIEAYEGLPAGLRNEYELWVAGKKMENVKIKMQNDNAKSKIRFLGYVPDSELPGLYQNAAVFVYPSLYEGFGLPVLEAMAGGTPTICSKQIVGNFKFQISNDKSEPFIAVDPESVEDLKNAMKRVLGDSQLAKQMGQKGVEMARRFTWERAARETMRVYEENWSK
ncbi:MAG: hypothetical protein A2846_02580 [Candidatus Doudnabacteria bacterium RIFCSPHIGHO2_01_FULL_49_9]|uniref:Glycosyl transferase family 1 domain-containing protein n=1 Tax=Candidatus Doudnabacteria bacterium RIFCSPHIGHO2_01_FULL_49_9 TaxID=1817827 RepID=A0A1F5P3A9_9BACT|nr:MAG: hypothetical protein A2846_02580 [Candidatus Doudnabacteria bacterium RIFCSPHIGHO2_01_FULL_49_9]